MQSNIEALRQENDKLAQLLEDPHPGLMTWREFVIRRVEAMAEIIGLEAPDE